jgi:hypothetical protein
MKTTVDMSTCTAARFPFVQAFARGGREYRYFRRLGYPRVPLPGKPGSAEFNHAYQEALAGRVPERKLLPVPKSTPTIKGPEGKLLPVPKNTSTIKGPIRYSPTEARVRESIGRAWITSDELIIAVYGRKPPLHARNMVNTAVHSLMKKMEINHDPILIERFKTYGTRTLKMRRTTR